MIRWRSILFVFLFLCLFFGEGKLWNKNSKLSLFHGFNRAQADSREQAKEKRYLITGHWIVNENIIERSNNLFSWIIPPYFENSEKDGYKNSVWEIKKVGERLALTLYDRDIIFQDLRYNDGEIFGQLPFKTGNDKEQKSGAKIELKVSLKNNILSGHLAYPDYVVNVEGFLDPHLSISREKAFKLLRELRSGIETNSELMGKLRDYSLIKARVSELDRQNQGIQEANSSLGFENQDLREANSELRERNSRLREIIRGLYHQNDGMRSQISENQKDIMVLKKRINDDVKRIADENETLTSVNRLRNQTKVKAINLSITVLNMSEVRSDPDVGSEILYKVKAGEVLNAIGHTIDHSWYEIVKADGTKGYIFSEEVEGKLD